jgi:hypothetical protein
MRKSKKRGRGRDKKFYLRRGLRAGVVEVKVALRKHRERLGRLLLRLLLLRLRKRRLGLVQVVSTLRSV